MLSQFVFVLKIKIKCGLIGAKASTALHSFAGEVLIAPLATLVACYGQSFARQPLGLARLYLKPCQDKTHHHLVCGLHSWGSCEWPCRAWLPIDPIQRIITIPLTLAKVLLQVSLHQRYR